MEHCRKHYYIGIYLLFKNLKFDFKANKILFPLRACRYGNKKVAVTLLDRGCTPCLRNARGVTPLHLACQYRHMDIAKVKTNYL